MAANKRKLNTDKTELLVTGSQFRNPPHLGKAKVGSDSIVPSESARNIGVIFDRKMDYKEHITQQVNPTFHARFTEFMQLPKAS